MNRILLFILLLFAGFTTRAQPVFQTIAPERPVVVGESFVVQYLVDASQVNGFDIPSFYPFRAVEGPTEYPVKNQQAGVKNLVYTLTAITSGHFTLPRAVGQYKGRNIFSQAVAIDVLSSADAEQIERLSHSNQKGPALKPGQNAEAFVRENVFIKAEINRQQCYVGQPVIATFKLYSALHSHSDIVKNPAFYGFTALDMINLKDSVSSTEVIRGKIFDVHVIRKVQLYPSQPGRFRIDPMEISTSVDSGTLGHPQQKITEGAIPGSDNDKSLYRAAMSSPELFVTVNPLPAAGQPQDFEGATGNFSIKTDLSAPRLARNEEGQLTITIIGKGNFTQIAAPAIAWPKGIEGFDSSVTDKLDKTICPVSGSRSFRYSFVSNTPGTYTIPALRFVFFDTDSNRYKTLTTQPQNITIDNRLKEAAPKLATYSTEGESRSWWLIIAIMLILASAIGILIWKNKKPEHQEKAAAAAPVIKSPASFLASAREHLHEPAFYQYLQSGIWQFIGDRYHLTGSSMSKQNLLSVLKQRQTPEADQQELLQLLQETETGIYTVASLDHDREMLLSRAEQLLEKLDNKV
jgi:hypothetical protein